MKPDECDFDSFEKGWYAGLRGDDPRTCPYDDSTREWWEWQRSYKRAATLVRTDDEPVSKP